jgi:hypothetical protein
MVRGGHVEPDDPGLRAVLVREIREEVGGEPPITGLLHVLADEHQRQYFYLGRLQSWSETGRTGPEFDDPDRGEYRLEEIPPSIEALDGLSVNPEELAALLRSCATPWPPRLTLLRWRIRHANPHSNRAHEATCHGRTEISQAV